MFQQRARKIALLAMAMLFCVGNTPVRAQSAVDLSSTQADHSAASVLQVGQTANLMVGGSTRQIGAGSNLTAAEFAALSNLVATGRQGLVLDAAGRAIAGQISLNTLALSNINSLTIPSGVVAIDSMTSSSLNVLGALNVLGVLAGYPTSPGATFNIDAGSVNVGAGGAIVTQLTPGLGSLLSQLSGINGLLSGLAQTSRTANLDIDSLSTINNAGLIASSGALSLSAGGDITNTGNIVSLQDASFMAGSGGITNAGLINADKVTFNAGAGQNLLVSNLGGIVDAARGSIILEQLSGYVTGINGGHLIAKTVDVFAGHGLASVDVDQIDGIVNVKGCSAFVSTKAGDLVMGTMDLTGDPTIENAGGDVVLTSNLSFPGQDLAILASGNIVVAPGANVTSISVGDAGNAGDLHISAGFDFINTGGLNRQITGASVSGGSIALPGVNLIANSQTGSGGTVIIVAHEGADNAGSIQLKSIDASSGSGAGGLIAVIAQNGINVGGNLSVSGAAAGDLFLFGAEPQIAGTIAYSNGTLQPGGQFVAGSTSAAANFLNAPNIIISGDVLAQSSAGDGGLINAVTTGNIALGNVNSSGGGPNGDGGNAGFVTLAGTLSIGNVTANGAGAGNGATIDLRAPGLLSTKSLSAVGGSNAAGGGGNGGLINLQTANNNPNTFFVGSTLVAGTMDTSGGVGLTTGGNGGVVQARSGTLRITGTLGNGNSVQSLGGAGATPGGNGTVFIRTYGTQLIPANFNLTSAGASETAIPGGLFEVGNATVNGTAGSIANGGATATSVNASHIIDSTPFLSGTLTLRTFGSSQTIEQNGVPVLITSDSAGVRTKVTPAQALALYLVSHNSAAGSQTIGLNASGQLVTLNPGGVDSFANINNFELPQQFTSFNLQNVAGDGRITLNILGLRTILNMPTSQNATIGGDIGFATGSRADINFAGRPVSLPYGSNIFGLNSDITLRGTASTWTNNGRIEGGTIIIDHQGKALTLNMDTQNQNLVVPGSAGLLSGTSGVVFRNPKSSMNIKGGALDGPLFTDGSLTTLSITSQFSNNVELVDLSTSAAMNITASTGNLVVAPGAVLNSGTVMNLTAAGTGADAILEPGAQLNAGTNLTIRALAGTIIDNGAIVTAGAQVEYISTGGITLSAGTDLYGANGVGILAGLPTVVAPVTINGATVEADKSGIVIFGTGLVTIGPGSTIEAGDLKPTAPATGILASSDVQNFGIINISSNTGVDLQSDLTSNGGDIQVLVSPAGNITLASGLTLQANGGSVILLTQAGDITGSNETLVARAVGTPLAFRGGGIEVGSGLQLSQSELLAYYRTRGPSLTLPTLGPGNVVADPSLLGAGVTVDSNGATLGLVSSNTSGGGTVDLGGSSIDITKGAAVFDALGAGNSVSLTGSTFESHSVDYVPGGAADLGIVTAKLDLFLFAGNFLAFTTTLSNTVTATDQNSDLLGQLGIDSRLSAALTKFDDGSGSRNSQILDVTVGNLKDNRVFTPEAWNRNRMSLADDSDEEGGKKSSKQDGEVVASQHSIGERGVIRVNQMRSDMLFFTQASQMLQGNLGGASDAAIYGAPGTALTNGKTVVFLHTGRIVADTGKDPLIIATAGGEVRVAPHSSVAVDADLDGPVQVKALSDSGEESSVTVRDGAGRTGSVVLASGEALVVGEDQLTDPDLIPIDGSGGAVVSAGISVTTKKAHFNVRDFAEATGVITSERVVHLGAARRKGSRLAQHLAKGAAGQKGAPPSRGRLASGPPIEFGTEGAPVHILAAIGTEFLSPKDGVIEMRSGSMFLEVEETTKLKINKSNVIANAGAVVGIESDGKTARIKSCSMPGTVALDVGNAELPLRAGHELTISERKMSEQDIMSHDGVGRRALSFHSDGKRHVALSEFSICSLIKTTTYLRPLQHPATVDGERKLDRLLKVAAATEVMGSKHGRYQTAKPETASR